MDDEADILAERMHEARRYAERLGFAGEEMRAIMNDYLNGFFQRRAELMKGDSNDSARDIDRTARPGDEGAAPEGRE
jgi:hypothetical protein